MYDGFATIVLRVRDLVDCAEFYQRALGFTLDGWWHPTRGRLGDAPPASTEGSFVELSAGPVRVRLEPSDAACDTGCDVSLPVRDLDVLHRRVAEVRPDVGRPETGVDGRRSFAVVAPDGQRWVLVQR